MSGNKRRLLMGELKEFQEPMAYFQSIHWMFTGSTKLRSGRRKNSLGGGHPTEVVQNLRPSGEAETIFGITR